MPTCPTRAGSTPAATRRHALLDVLAIALCAALSGAEGFVDMARFGQAREGWLRERLGLGLPGGIPSHDNFGRVFTRLDPAAFSQCFLAWTQALHEATKGQAVALDGKSNEITALPALLALLDLSGSTVTIGAMGCQAGIAAQVTARGGDYALALKGNHPTLWADTARLFGQLAATGGENVRADARVSRWSEGPQKDHGRIETRRYCLICALPGAAHWLDPDQRWAGRRAVGLAECERRVGDQVTRRVGDQVTRRVGDQVTRQARYYLTDAAAFGRAVRGHWGIENRLHWVLDVAMGEDGCRVRKDHAPQNLTALHRLALNLLRQETTDRSGIKARRLRAGWDTDYLLRVLTGTKK